MLPWVDVATGSLGQGLPDGVGVALAGKYLDRLPYRVWVLCGDSEMAEGSMWEALDKAGALRASNLVAIVDVNRLGQRGPTELGWDMDDLRAPRGGVRRAAPSVSTDTISRRSTRRFAATEQAGDRPTVILARTIKGRGFSDVEDKDGWHGKALPADMAATAIAEIGGERDLRARTRTRYRGNPAVTRARPGKPQRVDVRAIARRQGRHPQGLRRRPGRSWRRDPSVVALDGEVSNSTYADRSPTPIQTATSRCSSPSNSSSPRRSDCSVRGYVPFASTFAAFLTPRP